MDAPRRHHFCGTIFLWVVGGWWCIDLNPQRAPNGWKKRLPLNVNRSISIRLQTTTRSFQYRQLCVAVCSRRNSLYERTPSISNNPLCTTHTCFEIYGNKADDVDNNRWRKFESSSRNEIWLCKHTNRSWWWWWWWLPLHCQWTTSLNFRSLMRLFVCEKGVLILAEMSNLIDLASNNAWGVGAKTIFLLMETPTSIPF